MRVKEMMTKLSSNVLIFNQILPTSNIRNIRRIVRRIWLLILRLKGLRMLTRKEKGSITLMCWWNGF